MYPFIESGIGFMLFLIKLLVFSGLSWFGMKTFRYYYEKYPFKRFKKLKRKLCNKCNLKDCKECELKEEDIVGYAPEEDDLP